MRFVGINGFLCEFSMHMYISWIFILAAMGLTATLPKHNNT